jgi:hypothetical protein
VKKNVGIDEYTEFGSIINKNCVTLFNINTINRTFVWCKKQRINNYDILFPHMVLNMILIWPILSNSFVVMQGKKVWIFV